jgi:type IV pilus assembly protein PilO
MVTLPLGAIAVAYVVWVFFPSRRAISDLEEQVLVKHEIIEQAAERATALTDAKHHLEKVQTYCAARQQLMVGEKELPLLFGKIHEAARAAGANTTRFDPQPATGYERLRRTPLTIGCSGSFAQVYEFLRSLETMPAAIWIESVKIEKINEDEKGVHCEASLVIFAGNSDISDYAKRAK